MDRGTCWAMIYRVTKNWTQLKQFSTHILKLQRIKSKKVTFLARNVKRPLKRGEVKVMQACLTLYNPMDCIVHGILQARILEWVIVPFSRGSTVRGILQARILECIAFPFSRGSSQPGIKLRSPTLQPDSLPAEPQRKPKNREVGIQSLLPQFVTTWTIQSMEFTRPEYWSG